MSAKGCIGAVLGTEFLRKLRWASHRRSAPVATH